MKGATYVGFTSDAAKKVASQCCEAFKNATGSADERAKIMAECFARAAASAGAAAACVAGGVTAPFAGVCATVGAFMADRVMGYNKTQLAAGTAASIACAIATGGSSTTTCFYAAAEVVGWVGDKLGPIVESIFDPNAAKRRERARRDAMHSLYFASQASVVNAGNMIDSQWSDAVNRIADLFTSVFPAAYYESAKTKLGFGNDYHSIAMAFLGLGVPMTVMSQEYVAACDGGKKCRVCENYAKPEYSGKILSPICPPLIVRKFYEAVNKGSNTLEEDSGQAQQAANELLPVANAFFFQLPIAESALAAKIAVVAVAIKQQQALDEANQATRSKLATKAASAASAAEAAAEMALNGNAKESEAAVARAKNRYDQALAAYNLVISNLGSESGCAKDADCQRAATAVARAKSARDLAIKNAATATTKRYLIGGGLAAAAAGGIYLFLRK